MIGGTTSFGNTHHERKGKLFQHFGMLLRGHDASRLEQHVKHHCISDAFLTAGWPACELSKMGGLIFQM